VVLTLPKREVARLGQDSPGALAANRFVRGLLDM
jgi:hypothetical protein